MKRRRKPVVSPLWSSRDKVALLAALRDYGPHKVTHIARAIRTKTPQHVQRRIALYRGLAHQPLGRQPRDELAGLNAWLRALPSTANRAQLPIALRLIAALETQSASYAPLYEYLASLLEGGFPTKTDEATSDAFYHSILQLTQKISRANTTEHKDFAYNVTRIFPDIRTPTMTTDLPGAESLLTLLSSVVYNPLEVPDRLLLNNF